MLYLSSGFLLAVLPRTAYHSLAIPKECQPVKRGDGKAPAEAKPARISGSAGASPSQYHMTLTTFGEKDVLVDTHVHTRYSDGTAGVPRIERHCRDRGMGLAVTDHNEIRGAVHLFEREIGRAHV